ncbi:MAG: glycosyltransferase [Eubacterium sp.]|nr:glycosyltransferase [Eubacterium sp.]
MKITQLFKIYWPDNGGGIAKVMESIADAFEGCQQEMIVCQDDRHKKSAVDRYKGIQVHRCRQLFECVSTPLSLDFLYKVKRCTSDSDFVIYHFPYPMADFAVLLGMYSGRLIVWWHCGFEQYKRLAPFYRPLVKHTLKKADLVLVSSKGNLKHSALLRKYQGKCRVIPFCVSDECMLRGMAYAAKHSVQKNKITILFIGRLVWYKGCDVLIKAFARLQAKMQAPDCRLVIVGSGPLEQRLKRLAASLRLKDVIFAGMVSEEEKMKWLEQCDFLVLPSVSKAEAFAVVQIEAMAFGKPVINTRLPSGVPYVSLDGVTGITVSPGSIRELAAAMQKLAEHDCLRKQYGENARKRVQKKYTKQVMAAKYRQLFAQLLKETAYGAGKSKNEKKEQ